MVARVPHSPLNLSESRRADRAIFRHSTRQKSFLASVTLRIRPHANGITGLQYHRFQRRQPERLLSEGSTARPPPS